MLRNVLAAGCACICAQRAARAWRWLALALAVGAVPALAQPPRLSPTPQPLRPRGPSYDVELAIARGERAEEGDCLELLLDWDEEQGAGLALFCGARETAVFLWHGGLREELARGPGVLPAPGEQTLLRIKRRRGSVRLLADDRLALVAFGAPAVRGAVGLSRAEGVRCPKVRLWQAGPVAFGADFEQTKNPLEGWHMLLGKWRHAVYRDPFVARTKGPPNACWLEGEGANGALAVVGRGWWADYAVEASVLAPEEGEAGVACYAHGGERFCAFAISQAGGTPACRLFVVEGGKEHVLGRRRLAQRPRWWYRLRLEASAGYVRALVNGAEVLSGYAGGLCDGQAGVYARGQKAEFDDFFAASFRSAISDFAPGAQAGLWGESEGEWRAVRGALVAYPSSRCARWLRGEPWEAVDARVWAAAHGEARGGLALRGAGSEGEEVNLLVEPSGWRVVCAGEELAAGKRQGWGAELRVVVRRWSVSCYVEGRLVARRFALRPGGVRVGLVAEGEGQVRFERFRAVELAREPVGTRLDDTACVYRSEELRGKRVGLHVGVNWRPEEGKWREGDVGDVGLAISAQAAGNKPALLRYAEPVCGDVAAQVALVRPAEGAAGLAICTEEKRWPSGYALAMEEKAKRLVLLREGQEVAQAEVGALSEEDFPLALRLVREGRAVFGELGEKARVLFVDEQPLRGLGVALFAEGEALFAEPLVGNLRAMAHSFRSVEPEWTPLCGTWLAHSGMACIPWSHWISGMSRELAVLELDRPVFGEQIVRVRISEYTEGYETGEHRHFPLHDVRVSLCAEQGKPDSGYTVELGGEGGKYTRIWRRGKVVAETADEKFRITMGSHCNSPREIACVVIFRGGKLSVTFNGAPCISFQDKEPLSGGYISLGVARGQANFADFAAMPDTVGADEAQGAR